MKSSPSRLAYLIGRLAQARKAEDIRVLDVRKLTELADYLVVCTASVDLHGRAIADSVIEALEGKKVRLLHKEGYLSSSWILLDYVDVILHIFLKESRKFYNLEGLWGDAPQKILSEKGKFMSQNGQRKVRRKPKR